jgi:hypothetical protein
MWRRVARRGISCRADRPGHRIKTDGWVEVPSCTRYQGEEELLKKKAKGFEAQYDALNFRDDQFDLSDAALSISLALLAVR